MVNMDRDVLLIGTVQEFLDILCNKLKTAINLVELKQEFMN